MSKRQKRERQKANRTSDKAKAPQQIKDRISPLRNGELSNDLRQPNGQTDQLIEDEIQFWMAKKKYDEINRYCRFCWDMYLKFYTVFLTMNVAGLGLVVQYIDINRRWPLIVAFAIQNTLSAITAVSMGLYSRSVASQLIALRHQITGVREFDPPASSVPAQLMWWAGLANAIASITLVFCWVAILSVKSP